MDDINVRYVPDGCYCVSPMCHICKNSKRVIVGPDLDAIKAYIETCSWEELVELFKRKEE